MFWDGKGILKKAPLSSFIFKGDTTWQDSLSKEMN